MSRCNSSITTIDRDCLDDRDARDNVAITKENMISPHRDRIMDRDGHARYANTMLDYLFPVLYLYAIRNAWIVFKTCVYSSATNTPNTKT